MLVVISYDIPDDKKRTKVNKIISNYGINVQKSVFECDINNEEINQLKNKIEKIINPDFDDLRIYLICNQCNNKVIIISQKSLNDKIKKIIV